MRVVTPEPYDCAMRLLPSRARAGTTDRVAVVTMVRDEAAWLPVWLRHYGEQVGADHLLVLDDSSSDGSTDALSCEVRRIDPLPGGSRFEPARMRVISAAAEALLDTHDWVVFADADELVVPTTGNSLGEHLATRRSDDILGPVALNVLHHASTESRLDLDRPLLDQRSLAQFAPLMCKPAVKQVAIPWAHSAHGIRGAFRIDPELYLLHLKFADRDLLSRNVAHRNALVAADGRAGGSSWSRDDLVEILDARMAGLDPAAVDEFDPATLGADALVPQHEPSKNLWRAPRGHKQARALATQPIVRIPASLSGAL